MNSFHCRVACCVLSVVGATEPASLHKVKVNGIRATLGDRSRGACLEKISYDGVPPTGSRLRLHLTIDQSFKDRLAQTKKTMAAGQWSPITPIPACPAVVSSSGHNRNSAVDDSVCSGTGTLVADLATILENYTTHELQHGYAQPMTMDTSQGGTSSVVDSMASVTATTTPADLSDLSAVDLLHFPADWNVELTDVDVDADFFPFTDIRPSVTDLGSLFLTTKTDYIANSQSDFLGAQLPTMTEPFPVYGDDIGAYTLGDDAPMFDNIDDVLWNTYNIRHAISVQ